MNISTMQQLSSDPVVALKICADEVAESLVSELKEYVQYVRKESEGTYNAYLLELPEHPNRPGDPDWTRTLAIKVRDLALQKLDGGATLEENEGRWRLNYTDSDPSIHPSYGDWAQGRIQAAINMHVDGPIDLSLPAFNDSKRDLHLNASLKAWYPQGLANIEVSRSYKETDAKSFRDGFTDGVYGAPRFADHSGIAWRSEESEGIQMRIIHGYEHARELREQGWLVQDKATYWPSIQSCMSCCN